jgi:hypothetical protein
LGLKHGSSAGIGLSDLNGVLEAFETMNEVHLKVELERRKVGSERELFATAVAFEVKAGRQVAKPLASQSVRCLGKRLETMEAVVLQLLYALDYQLAQHELTDDLLKMAEASAAPED